MQKSIKIYEEQLEAVIGEYESVLSKSSHDDASDVPCLEIKNLQTRCIASIERISGRKSTYFRQVKKISKQKANIYDHTAEHIGVAKALLSDLQKGYLESLGEMLHGNLFSDFLEMAEYLLEKNFKDAAAVIAGSTLEVHIRKLCEKYDVPTTSKNKKKKSDTLNAELVKKGAYSKSDQKMVTSCLDTRNSAAHGSYSEYDNARVKLFISQVRYFISKHPA